MPRLTLSSLLRTAARDVRRILFARAADAANFNAQAKNVQNILRHWSVADVRPVVVSFGAPDPGVAANPNVDIIAIAPDRLWRAKLFAAYLGAFDAVFCPGLHHYADWAALKLRALGGRPLRIIGTVEGLLSAEGDDAVDRAYSDVAGHPVYSQKVAPKIWRRADELLMMADKIIAISPFLARQTAARYEADVAMLPLGVDGALFQRAQWERRTRPHVVCAAHVQPHKQPEIFVRLAARFPQANFTWFGEGELRAGLVAQAARDNIANVTFPGLVAPDVLACAFGAADIMVLPSRNEGVPKVTQEAAASGLAQIVFGFYETPSVSGGVNGFVVWNESEMAEKLATLIADAGLRERMGRAGADMARNWRWDLVAPRWQAVILETALDEKTSARL